MADGDHYSNDSDADKIYGSENIVIWSDITNSGFRDTSRTDWAHEQAKIQIDGRMTDGPYGSQIPFGVRSSNNVPPMMQLISATLAGLMLFDTRRVISAQDPLDQVSQQRKNFDMWIRQILSGQMKLRDTSNARIDKDSFSYPFNVEVDLT